MRSSAVCVPGYSDHYDRGEDGLGFVTDILNVGVGLVQKRKADKAAKAEARAPEDAARKARKQARKRAAVEAQIASAAGFGQQKTILYLGLAAVAVVGGVLFMRRRRAKKGRR
jgi:hypothetical protein